MVEQLLVGNKNIGNVKVTGFIVYGERKYKTRSFQEMMYLLAILLPPVAVLFCGKPFQAVINFILSLIFWVPGVIHAILVVHDKKQIGV